MSTPYPLPAPVFVATESWHTASHLDERGNALMVLRGHIERDDYVPSMGLQGEQSGNQNV